MLIRTALAAWFAAVFLAPCLAQSMPKGLKAAVEGYEKAQKAAKEEFGKDIDRTIDTARKSKADASVVDRHLKEMKAQKEAFEKKGDLPTHDDLLGPTLEYLDRLRKGRAELNRAFKQQTDEAKRTKDDDLLSQLVKAKAGLDAQVGGRDQFQSKTQWDGTRFAVGTTVDAHLSVGKLSDNTFRGQYWQDTGSAGKFGMKVEGLLDGNALEFVTTEMIEGDKRILKFSGYVFENRMILRVSGVTPKGKPANGIIDFRKK